MDTPNSPAVAVPAEAEAYCVKCKGKRKMVNAEITTVKNGKNALKGKCEVCGTTMMKFLGGKKEAAPAVEAAS